MAVTASTPVTRPSWSPSTPARTSTARSRTPNWSSSIIEKVVINDDGGSAIVDDFGITTDAGALVFGAAVEDPADTFTYTAATLDGRPPARTPSPSSTVAGYAPTAWTCTNGDGGAFDAGTVTHRRPATSR